MRTFLIALMCFIAHTSFGQTDKSKRPSPPDSVQITTTDGVTIRVDYSRPSLKGREIGVDIVFLGKRWRTGANEATTIEIDKDIRWNDKVLKAGKYSLSTIPGEQTSTLILNKDWNQWGTKYNEANDVLRVEVPTIHGSNFQEQFKIDVDKTGLFTLAWGTFELQSQIKAN